MYKKYKKEPQIKIGSKKENILYSEKNINPELNYLNKQLSEEEHSSNMRKKYQKEELSALSKNYQDNYMGPPNLAHQRIDFDNVSGKIGQEKREMDIDKYQQQPSFAKDQIYSTYLNNDKDKDKINKKYYHNIINNTIFGFCDPSMKYPKTSYQSNYKGNDINEQLKYLSQRQYEDYLRFRKEQIEMMNKGNLGKNLRELPPRQKMGELRNVETPTIQEIKNMREKQYQEKLDNLIKEQRMLDQNQVRTLNPSGYIPTPEEYELYLQQQRINAMNALNNNTNDNNSNLQNEKIPIQENKEIKNNFNENIPSSRTPRNENYYNNYINDNREIIQEKEKQMIGYNPEDIEKYKYNNNNTRVLSPKEAYNNYRNEAPENYEEYKFNNNNNKMPPKEGYNYGNEVPENYEEYKRLMEKEKLGRERMANENEERYYTMQANRQNMINNNNNNEEDLLYDKEQRIKEMQRKEAEEEYLKNVKKYEDIIQDNPEQRFKLPPPPFGANNIPSLNQMGMDSQLQGASIGYINKSNLVSENPYSINNYSLGETNLKTNPIVHPVNSYQFDYKRLYNPLTNKK